MNAAAGMGSLYYAAVEGCQIGPCLRILPAFFSCPGSGLALPQGVLFDMTLSQRPLRHAGNQPSNGPVLSSRTLSGYHDVHTNTTPPPPATEPADAEVKQLPPLADHRDAVAGTLERLHNPPVPRASAQPPSFSSVRITPSHSVRQAHEHKVTSRGQHVLGLLRAPP